MNGNELAYLAGQGMGFIIGTMFILGLVFLMAEFFGFLLLIFLLPIKLVLFILKIPFRIIASFIGMFTKKKTKGGTANARG